MNSSLFSVQYWAGDVRYFEAALRSADTAECGQPLLSLFALVHLMLPCCSQHWAGDVSKSETALTDDLHCLFLHWSQMGTYRRHGATGVLQGATLLVSRGP